MLKYFELNSQIMSEGQKSLKFLLNYSRKYFSNNLNVIESLDRFLKALCPTGKINYFTAVEIIQG